MLGRALVADFPDRYGLFSKTYVVFGDGSQPTLNGWLSAYRGAEGIKTGFTCGSGYNLLAAASRQGRRLIGVVLGARTGGKRNALMRKLMDAGFAAPADGRSDERRVGDECVSPRRSLWSQHPSNNNKHTGITKTL